MLNKLSYGLFYLMLVELVLGGGGRLVAFGPVSLRMILFSMAMVVTLLHLANGARLDTKYLRLLIIFTSTLVVGALVGFLCGANIRLIWEDLKPLLFFYLLPFFVI